MINRFYAKKEVSARCKISKNPNEMTLLPLGGIGG
jgi:hypothetical protein